MKKDGAEFEDEEYCTPYAGPESVEHQALHLPRIRGCFGCDHGKAQHQYKRRSKGATIGLTGPDVALKPLVHVDWLEMKNGSKAHGIAASALLITDQETEFLGVLPSKRKLASDVVRALHDLDDPGSPAIRRLLSDRAPEFVSAGRTLRSSRPFAHFVTVPYWHASKAERTARTAVESTRASLLQAGFPDTWWAVSKIYFVAMWNGHMRGRDGFYSLPAQARRRRAVSDVPVGVPDLRHICTNPSLRMRERQVALEPDSLHPGGSDDGSGWSLGALLRRCASLQVHWLESAVGCARETQHRHRLS